MTLSREHFKIALGLLAVLLVANLVYYFCTGWGLITVKAHEVPLGQVIRSIERQGWVTIYSNIDPQTKISMYVDHVPLPEAMETLAVNADAQWHLGFFVAPNSAQVKEEIRTFTEAADNDDDDTKIYSFPTSLAMIDTDGNLPVADPRRQTWPGVPAPPAPPPSTDATATTAAPDDGGPPPDPAPDSAQGYLRAFALGADIWIMAPASWDPPVATAPAPEPSISSAIDRFVNRLHGSVTQAIVLRGRPPRVAGEQRPRGGFRGGGMDFSLMEVRIDNAINGLPTGLQPAARAQLAQETTFQKEVRAMPPEQRRKAWREHMLARRMNDDGMWKRASPEKRAQIFSRLVSNRMAAQGK